MTAKSYDQLREEHGDSLFKLQIETHVPEKWRAVDMATGNVWAWDTTKKRWRQGSARDVIDTLEAIGQEPSPQTRHGRSKRRADLTNRARP